MAAKYDLNDDSVVVIIGSGAGGGTLANELAQKGIKVVVLEAGKRYEIGDFINNEWERFISDGSQFTTGGAENPTLTIVTLAIRQADYIAEQMSKNTI